MSRNALVVRRYRALLLTLFLASVTHRVSTAADQSPASINSGLVIVDGQLIDGPYAVEARKSDVLVNGLTVGHIGGQVVNSLPFEDNPTNAAIADVERLLLQDGLLLRHHGTVLLLPGLSSADGGGLTTDIIACLISDLPTEETLRLLATYDDPAIRHMTTQRWQELIGLFQQNRQLAGRITERCCGGSPIDPNLEVALNEAIIVNEFEPSVDLSNQPLTEAADISESVQYGVNLFGMVAGVIALGSLLSLRPNTDRPWRELNGSDAGMKLVARCGGLIVLLGLFDLVCTLMAIHTGMFRELNPVASQLTSSPMTVVVFKLAAMTAGVGLLWRLREYVGAQTAAWWMCLVCTLVVFRWLTFHSMFIA
jgi:hypothetical protein